MLFTNATIISSGTITGNMAVRTADGKIVDLLPSKQVAANEDVIDLKGAYLAPGFIDLQIYGSSGYLFGGIPSEDALAKMESDLVNQGTTGFLAAVATNETAVVDKAIEAAVAYRKKARGNFLGLHLEGPYLNPVRRGAHPEQFIKKATAAEVSMWIEAAEGEIRVMTLAPELQDPALLSLLEENNVTLFCGHSNATYEEGQRFFKCGRRGATHLYNAMPLIHHREAGLVPAIFKEKPYTSIVADGIHVSFPMIELAKRELGNKLFLITDAVTEAQEGTYQHVFQGDRYTMPDGTLSGSALSMLKAVENCVVNAGIPLEEAVNMASLYPAEVLGMQSRKGKIETGYDADLVVFDKDFKVIRAGLH